MAEQTQKTLQLQVPEYESVEQKLVRNIKPIGRGICNFGEGIYGGIAGYFRLPTSIRKLYNKQNSVSRRISNKQGNNVNAIGTGLGINCPWVIPIFASSEFNENALYIFLATNLASGIYELGRLSRSKLEHKILKESKK